PLQLRAVTALGCRLPFCNLPVLLDLLQAVEHRLAGKVIKFLPAEIIVAPFHVADAQLAQMLLQERNVLEVELLLQVLGASGDDDALAAANDRKKISQGFARARSGLYDQVPFL